MKVRFTVEELCPDNAQMGVRCPGHVIRTSRDIVRLQRNLKGLCPESEKNKLVGKWSTERFIMHDPSDPSDASNASNGKISRCSLRHRTCLIIQNNWRRSHIPHAHALTRTSIRPDIYRCAREFVSTDRLQNSVCLFYLFLYLLLLFLKIRANNPCL